MTDFDAVVIGAGVLGCNAAWHLQERGCRVLVLDEARGPATRTTRAAAGFVCLFSTIHRQEWGQTEWLMQDYGIEFYSRLSQSTGKDFAFHRSGIAYLYLTEQGWTDIQPCIATASAYGTPLEVLTSHRAQTILPQVAFDTTVGIIFDSRSLRLRAADAIPALAAQVEQRGGEIRYDVKVDGFALEGGRVSGVRTTEDVVAGECVVVAAGAWSRPLLAPLVCLPGEPTIVARYTTRPLPGVDEHLPMLMFSDSVHRFFIREERGGLLIGGADLQPLPVDRAINATAPPHGIDGLPHDHAYRMREHLRKVEHVLPLLRQADIEQTDAGLPVYTEDRRFVADSIPGVEGLYALAACNEAGVTHGPALGRHLAELIVDGDTRLPRSRYAIDRF